MTELLVSRGDTFPRSLLDTYRQSRASESFYCDLKTSKSDELVLQQDDILVPHDLHHGHSENLLDSHLSDSVGKCLSPTEPDFLDKPEVCASLPPVAPARDRDQRHRRRKVTVYDRVDPEDSIRDIVTENDFYRFVLFKKHYDKYLQLSQKYEEARNIAYYLEEKYHEVKSERDGLLLQRDQLSRRLESNECLLREKEDEVFVQFERVVYLEEQCDKLRAEKEKCWEQKQRIEKERDEALRLLKDQAKESESNRRKLERARQEVFRHMTKIKNEKESLERENGQLKEELEATTLRLHRQHRRRHKSPKLPPSSTTTSPSPYHQSSITPNHHSILQECVKAPMTARETALCSQFQKAMHHLATCKRRKCSVCGYTRAAFGKMGTGTGKQQKHDKRLFSCLQTPFLEVRNMLKPPPSPLRNHPNPNYEAESLSEWFCPLTNSTDEDDDDPNDLYCDAGDEGTSQSSSGGLSVPFAGMTISYMDDTASEVSRGGIGEEVEEICGGRKGGEPNGGGMVGHSSTRGFGSDSGFSSDMCATPKDKFSPRGTLDEAECAKLTRTKWTASFRKLINRIKK